MLQSFKVSRRTKLGSATCTVYTAVHSTGTGPSGSRVCSPQVATQQHFGGELRPSECRSHIEHNTNIITLITAAIYCNIVQLILINYNYIFLVIDIFLRIVIYR